jgi:hypothetical protein
VIEPDFLVVGSGPAGAHAAQTLLERGASVAMLDVGNNNATYPTFIPDTDFMSVRREDDQQHRYFLGDSFEGIPGPRVKTGAPLTPPRQYVTELVDTFLPVSSSTFDPLESLAYGGLGSAWGAGTCVYSDAELDAAGLDQAEMRAAYQVVVDRIGISGADDDARPYSWAGLERVDPLPALDETCARLLAAYPRNRARFHRSGLRMGRTALALITRDRGDRKAHRSLDMDFYSDADKSIYRPWMTVDGLRESARFTYVRDRLVLRFHEGTDGVDVECLDTQARERVRHRGRRLILAAGTLGTARIVLRSCAQAATSLPLLCNPYTYVPGIVPSMIGKDLRPLRLSLAQLSVFHDNDGTNRDVAMGSIYSYRSLMLFRILRQAPIDMADARILFRYLMPGLTILGIHHPERPGSGRTLRLATDAGSPTGDRLEVEYRLTDGEVRSLRRREKVMIRALRSLGSWAIKRIDPGMGSSIHYAGTLPFSAGTAPYTLRSDGRLSGTERVWVADGSGFRFLPAKGLTLSLMANAHVTAQAALRA